MKKIRVTVPYSVNESLENDRIEFEIEKLGTLGNKILNYYIGEKIIISEMKSDSGVILQFNLNKANEEVFIDGLIKAQRDNNLKSEEQLTDAEYTRNILLNYLNNPKAKREKIVFSQIVSELEAAMEKCNKIKIRYNNDEELRTVSPYYILEGDRESRNYLLCWCDKGSDYRCYRIAKITSTVKSFDERVEKDKKYIEELKKNFDPFRTYGSEVVAILTPQGESRLKSAITNRPRQLSVEEVDDKYSEESSGNKIYRFQCNETLGKIYFPQFLDEIEILEPESLREWFKNKFDKCVGVYKKE